MVHSVTQCQTSLPLPLQLWASPEVHRTSCKGAGPGDWSRCEIWGRRGWGGIRVSVTGKERVEQGHRQRRWDIKYRLGEKRNGRLSEVQGREEEGQETISFIGYAPPQTATTAVYTSRFLVSHNTAQTLCTCHVTSIYNLTLRWGCSLPRYSRREDISARVQSDIQGYLSRTTCESVGHHVMCSALRT